MKPHSLRVESILLAGVSLCPVAAAYQYNDDSGAAGGLAACGCLGVAGLIIIGILAINIAILVWVARDAKARSMDNSILWMVLVMLTGLLGLIIYLLVRPKGTLVACPHCRNKRLAVSAICPHCGNA